MRSSSHKARLLVPVAAALALAVLGGCAPAGAHRELRVGFIVPLTGRLAPFGGSHLEGARLAVAEENRAGGVLVRGVRFRAVLVEKDGSERPEQALAAAQELISKDAVAAIVGPLFSRQAIPVAHFVDKAGMPLIVQVATNPEVTRGTRTVYRVCATDDFQGEAMARFAFERLKARRVATLFDIAGAYSSGIAAIFSRSFAARGGQVVAEESYMTGAMDFRDQLQRIGAARPDLLFLPNYPNEILPQRRQMRELGVDSPIMGSDGMSWDDPEYMKAIEGAWYSVHFVTDYPNRMAAHFIAAYTALYKREPDQGAALSYDALGLLFSVVRAQQSVESRDIVEGLHRLDSYTGVTGTMTFRGSADPRKGIDVVRMGEQKPRFVARIEP
jgi:branched-chain amino acid transport system substrate-binding protein